MQTGALGALPAGLRRIKQRSQALETGGRTSGESALIVLHAHVHLLVNYPPKVQISKLVNSLKTASSRVIRKKSYPTVQRALWGGALWSPSYFAGSCGEAPIDIVKKYIQDQESPD